MVSEETVLLGQATVFSGTITIIEAIPPHLSLIVHPIMTQKESKVIVMIALDSLLFEALRKNQASFSFLILNILTGSCMKQGIPCDVRYDSFRLSGILLI